MERIRHRERQSMKNHRPGKARISQRDSPEGAGEIHGSDRRLKATKPAELYDISFGVWHVGDVEKGGVKSAQTRRFVGNPTLSIILSTPFSRWSTVVVAPCLESPLVSGLFLRLVSVPIRVTRALNQRSDIWDDPYLSKKKRFLTSCDGSNVYAQNTGTNVLSRTSTAYNVNLGRSGARTDVVSVSPSAGGGNEEEAALPDVQLGRTSGSHLLR